MSLDLSQYQLLSEQIQVDEAISIEEARELRLEYADRLEMDVARLQKDPLETSTIANEAEALE